MKYNLEHFSELMEQADVLAENKDELLKESDDLQFRLISDLTRSPSSEEVQEIVREIYDKKFGKGASEFTACWFWHGVNSNAAWFYAAYGTPYLIDSVRFPYYNTR